MREKTKRPEPSSPPWMVSHSVEASWRLYICIPAKSSRDRREESASEVPVATTEGDKSRGVRPDPPFRSRRQIRQVPELEAGRLPSATGTAATLPNFHPAETPKNSSAQDSPKPPVPWKCLLPRAKDTSALQGEGREK